MSPNELTNLAHFFFEVGHLKSIPRSGWRLLDIPNAETVAAHTCRSVFIAYVLAKMEGANAERAALIAAFHELPETRIGDLDKMAQVYFTDKRDVEKRVVQDQVKLLPKEVADEFLVFFNGFDHDTTIEHSIAKDADYLEVLLQAKEYLEQGYAGAHNWIDNASKCLKTDAAKKLAAVIKTTRSTQWFEDIKRIER